ncbi:cysteine--tRNA ligase [Persicobacter psychrovividus]|uniref:Cysteine--tRNA ligase n=1 Tax=Persicobacter psychrovividus TaxID=387638 RepID=A0ABM7VAT8_9BACT|nr:cysteine--tRNA ligase [Persicobacter psychrovividus]
MLNDLKVYNSLSGKKEIFEPLNPPFVGMYVCGPTVYSDVHLGNVRTFMCFDVINRYLKFRDFRVRYVRNITDVGHLINDADEGEDKIGRIAKLEKIEPMQVVQRYTSGFHQVMSLFNILPPDIEPSATGHIIEQIQIIQKIIDAGFAYESEGSIYFDIAKYNESNNYGELSGRVIEDLLETTRTLDGQEEKRSKADFALWKKASEEHIMRWPSPWGEGFPGWHLECTAMSTKYLGDQFDIHGGGLDLKFPHHECEIAQGKSATGKDPVKYWLHSNMLTVNGTKMSKSKGNSFLPHQLVSGNHELLEKGYSPMTVRFFMLQSHYSSPLDFSNDALKAAEKGYIRLANGMRTLGKLSYQHEEGVEPNEKQIKQINGICDNCYRAMNDDFNTAQTIAHLFNLLKKINMIHIGQLKYAEIGEEVYNRMVETFQGFAFDVLGLQEERIQDADPIIEVLLSLYKEAKDAKNYDKVDEIRSALKAQGIAVKDMRTHIDWAYDEK